MVYLGKPGAWDSWLQFQADAKHRRDDEAKALALAKYKRKQTILAWINGFIIVAAVVTGLVAVAGVVWLVVTKGGNG
jgi:t-SNARE complex subunit (syntaxin)